MTTRTLWITNDLPPRAGGIEQFVGNLLRRVDPEGALVIGPANDDAAAYDRDAPYRVERLDGGVWPTPAVLRRARAAAREHDPDVVVLGASWPLGELAPWLARDPGVPVVALSHGLEAGLAGVGLGWLVRRATRNLAVLTTISDFTESRLGSHAAADRVVRIPPGVDVEEFRPDRDGQALRRRWGIPSEAVVVGCISRLVRRKGQDELLAVWPELARRHPGAWLLIGGEGPLADELADAAAALGPDGRVVLPGRIPWEDLPAAYAALDVFAMPCRTRHLGTDVEGLGIVYLEAQASGVPVVAGTSGGAPETVLAGETGLVVDGRDRPALLNALDRLLSEEATRDRFGREGRLHVERLWSWDRIATAFRELLADVAA